MTRILVLADTHMNSYGQLAPAIAAAVEHADWVVHCGDYTGREFLDELRRRTKRFVGVYGNTDSHRVREGLPDKLTVEIGGKQIAVIHPAWGGPPWGLEDELFQMFRSADALLFGHTHEPLSQWRDHTLLFNPGQGYAMYGYPATFGMLTIDGGEMTGEILKA